jgi:hypothetical protein
VHIVNSLQKRYYLDYFQKQLNLKQTFVYLCLKVCKIPYKSLRNILRSKVLIKIANIFVIIIIKVI